MYNNEEMYLLVYKIISQADFKRKGIYMLNFVARVFRGGMNVLLWLILIGCAVGGFMAFGSGGREFNGGYAFLGLIVGGFIGLITVILSGGLIANFLNMVDNIENLNKLFSFYLKNQNIKIPEELEEFKRGKTGDEYVIKIDTPLKDDPGEKSQIIKQLKTKDIVYFQYAVDDYFYVKTSDSITGWCFGGHLKKRSW